MAVSVDTKADAKRVCENAIDLPSGFNEKNPTRNRTSVLSDHDMAGNSYDLAQRGVKRKAASAFSRPISPPPLKRPLSSCSNPSLHNGKDHPLERKAAPLWPEGALAPARSTRSANPHIAGRYSEGASRSSVHSPLKIKERRHDHAQSPAGTTLAALAVTAGKRDDGAVSLASSTSRSDRTSGGITKCSQCLKTSSKQYDSFDKCSACTQYFHDGCRKPPLATGADRAKWRCYRCISKKSTSASSALHTFDHENRGQHPTTPFTHGTSAQQTEHGASAIETHTQEALKLADRSVPANVTSKTEGKMSNVSGPETSKTHAPQVAQTLSTKQALKATVFPSTRRILNSAILNELSVLESVQLDELDDQVMKSAVPKRPSRDSQWPNITDVFDSSKEPDNFTQCSNQVQLGSVGPRVSHTADDLENHADSHGGPVNTTGNARPKFPLHSMVICSLCKRRRIKPKPGDENPMCFDCKNKSTSLDETDWALVIPETPELVPAVVEVSKQLDLPQPRSAASAPVAAGIIDSFFHKNLAASAPKIVTKKVARPKITNTHKQTISSNSPLHKVKLDETLTTGPDDNDRHPPISAEHGVNEKSSKETPLKPVRKQSAESESESHPSIDELFEGTLSDITSTLGSPSYTDFHDVHNATDQKVHKGQSQLVGTFAKEDGSYRSCGVAQKTSSNVTQRDISPSVDKPKKLTFRELIGMALVVADGSSLSAAEVQDRITATFPNTYRRGTGPWEKNIWAVLAQCNDFKKHTMPHSPLFKWTFASKQVRKDYEDKFPEYRGDQSLHVERPMLKASASVAHTPPKELSAAEATLAVPYATSKMTLRRNSSDIVHHSSLEDREDSTSSGYSGPTNSSYKVAAIVGPFDTVSPSVLPWEHGRKRRKLESRKQRVSEASSTLQREFQGSIPRAVTQISSPLPEAEAQADMELDFSHPVFLPFGSTNNLSIQPNLDKQIETDFFKAFPEYKKGSVESMTQEEIYRKIEEIKKRPSRKAMFGQLLTTARYQQKDVHNEHEDEPGRFASVASCNLQDSQADGDSNLVTRDKESQSGSLYAILSLPERPKAIIYDGQLAFRDGTLINGKLPRTKTVYKFGS